jgi:hypothetical protein
MKLVATNSLSCMLLFMGHKHDTAGTNTAHITSSRVEWREVWWFQLGSSSIPKFIAASPASECSRDLISSSIFRLT